MVAAVSPPERSRRLQRRLPQKDASGRHLHQRRSQKEDTGTPRWYAPWFGPAFEAVVMLGLIPDSAAHRKAAPLARVHRALGQPQYQGDVAATDCAPFFDS
jgi:hypothetical protein